MKKRMITLAVVVMLVPAALAFGQISFVGGFGSYCMPMAPETFTDYWEADIGFGGEVAFSMSETSALVGSFHMLNHKLDGEKILDDMGYGGMGLELEGGNLTGYAITANFMKYLSPPSAGAGFYVTAGGGYYSFKPDDATLSGLGQSQDIEMAEESETGFGLNGGVGIQFGSGSFAFFAEGRYHMTFIEMEEEEGFAGEGGNVAFLTVKGGIRLTL